MLNSYQSPASPDSGISLESEKFVQFATIDPSSMHDSELSDMLDGSSHNHQKSKAPPGSSRKRFHSFDFPGYGSYDVRATPDADEIRDIQKQLEQEQIEKEVHFLKEFEATAISGNDILSSTFYVSGLVSTTAGKMAPLCLAIVGFVLYLFRGIYHETVTALPVNGGTYNILLNCTSKPIASIAAVFGIIAYITTGVVSAVEAIAYLQTALPPGYEVDSGIATICLLTFFCLITNLGIKESAVLAKTIFSFHLFTLCLLTFFGFLYMVNNPRLLLENWDTPYPMVPSHFTKEVKLEDGNSSYVDLAQGGFWTAIFFGFSSAMLGVSGFETSAQFVEEQAPGVFPKTLRNMWAGVMFFNPLLSLISFSALRLSDIMNHTDTVLAQTAGVVGHWVETTLHVPDRFNMGDKFSTLVSLDAFIVLAAALLTSFIGINGLIRRMSMDRCLPQFFLIQNPWTHTDSFILVGFYLLCVSQVIIFDCDVAALGGVYCFAFLAVMIIFSIGNMLLKVKRPSLPREVSVSWIHAILGFLSVAVALAGNVLGKPQLLTFFFVYSFLVGILVFVMFQRVTIVRALYKMLNKNEKTEDRKRGNIRLKDRLALISEIDLTANFESQEETSLLKRSKDESCLGYLSSALKSMRNVPFVFFCKHDDVHMINKAILYIQSNEQTQKVIIIHCNHRNMTNTKLLADHVKLMDLLYPKVKISLLVLDAPFSDVVVEWVSRTLDIPLNAMFISCPDENFSMKVTQLRGMRIIGSY